MTDPAAQAAARELAALRTWVRLRYWLSVRDGRGEAKEAYAAVVEKIDERLNANAPRNNE